MYRDIYLFRKNFTNLKLCKVNSGFVFQIGLADVWLWCAMDFCRLATPDVMSVTPFAKEWSAKFEADPRVKNYLASRPQSNI